MKVKAGRTKIGGSGGTEVEEMDVGSDIVIWKRKHHITDASASLVLTLTHFTMNSRGSTIRFLSKPCSF